MNRSLTAFTRLKVSMQPLPTFTYRVPPKATSLFRSLSTNPRTSSLGRELPLELFGMNGGFGRS